jgi:hypothetical protein
VSGHFHHNLLELGWRDKSVIVGVEEPECLANPFSSEPLEELGELLEADNMVSTTFSKVQPDPVALKVERCLVRLNIIRVSWVWMWTYGSHSPRGWRTIQP